MVKIILSKIAKRDLKEIVDYIKRDSVKYAMLEKEKIKTAINKLYYQPELGKVFAKFNDNRYRELIHYHYSIIYKIASDKKIEILTIHHHSRLLSNNPVFSDDD